MLPIVTQPAALTCDDCGECCMHVGLPPFGGPLDPSLECLPKHLRVQMEQFYASRPPSEFSIDAPCPWLDQQTKRCTQYEWRPQACREFEVGSTGCASYRRKRGLHTPAKVNA